MSDDRLADVSEAINATSKRVDIRLKIGDSLLDTGVYIRRVRWEDDQQQARHVPFQSSKFATNASDVLNERVIMNNSGDFAAPQDQNGLTVAASFWGLPNSMTGAFGCCPLIP